MSTSAKLLPNLPRSLCECGHAGGGPNSQHDARYDEGHGPCLVKGCRCQQFTWERHLTPDERRDYARALSRHTRRQTRPEVSAATQEEARHAES